MLLLLASRMLSCRAAVAARTALLLSISALIENTRQHQALGGANLKWPVIDYCPAHVWSPDLLSSWCLPANCCASATSPRPIPALHVLGSDWRVGNHQALLPCCCCR